MRIAALVLVLLARVAHASEIGVVVAGEPVMQAPVLALVQGWLQERDYKLIAAPFSIAQTNSFIDCFVIEDMNCAKQLVDKQAKSNHVVFVRVDLVAAQTREYTFTAHWFSKGGEGVADKRVCQRCDESAMSATISALMASLEKSGGLGKGKLKIAATEPGMVVTLDGKLLGPPPIDRELPAGSHAVTFTRNGKVVATQQVFVEAGGIVDVATPVATNTDAPAPSPRRSRTLPATLLATGAAALIAGGVFLYYGSLDGPDEPYIYPDSNKVGLPLAIAGGASVVVGGVLLGGTF